jgi:hypothetical protein
MPSGGLGALPHIKWPADAWHGRRGAGATPLLVSLGGGWAWQGAATD